MTLKSATALFAAALLGACATAPEDMPRNVVFDWDLVPEARSSDRTVEQGALAMVWDADAPATHQTTDGNTVLPLVVGRTEKGNIYCAPRDRDDRCFEDRDGDARLDHSWEPVEGDDALDAFRVVASAKALPESLPLSVADSGTPPVFEQTLGLVYDGPVRGLIGEDGMFDMLMGAFMLGWHGGRDTAITPRGDGFYPVNTLPLIAIRDRADDHVFKDLGLRLRVRQADPSGEIAVRVETEPMNGVDVEADLDLDIDVDPSALPDFDAPQDDRT